MPPEANESMHDEPQMTQLSPFLEKVRGLRILYGVAALITLLASIWSSGIDLGWALVGCAGLGGVALLLYVVKWLGQMGAPRTLTMALQWFIGLLFMVWCILLTSSVFFRQPLDLVAYSLWPSTPRVQIDLSNPAYADHFGPEGSIPGVYGAHDPEHNPNWTVRYDFEIKQAGQYDLHIRYASARSQICRAQINNDPQFRIFTHVTGDWTCPQWIVEKQRIDLHAGVNTLTISAPGSATPDNQENAAPHIAEITLVKRWPW